MNNHFEIMTTEQKEEFEKLSAFVRAGALPDDRGTLIRLKWLTSIREVEHRVNMLLDANAATDEKANPVNQFHISSQVELLEILKWTDIEKLKTHTIRCACAIQFLVSMLANGKCAFIAEDIESE